MPRTYVDNAYNRSVGRVGLPVGSAVISKNTIGGINTRTYADNPQNRSLGRVGLSHGTAVDSKYSSGLTTWHYIDERPSKPVISTVPKSTSQTSYKDTSSGSHKTARQKTPVSVDDNYSAWLGHVDDIHGATCREIDLRDLIYNDRYDNDDERERVTRNLIDEERSTNERHTRTADRHSRTTERKQEFPKNAWAFPESSREQTRFNDARTAHHTPENADIRALCTCLVCDNNIEGATITNCGHRFCSLCIWQWLKTTDKCPACPKTVNADQLIHDPTFDRLAAELRKCSKHYKPVVKQDRTEEQLRDLQENVIPEKDLTITRLQRMITDLESQLSKLRTSLTTGRKMDDIPGTQLYDALEKLQHFYDREYTTKIDVSDEMVKTMQVHLEKTTSILQKEELGDKLGAVIRMHIRMIRENAVLRQNIRKQEKEIYHLQATLRRSNARSSAMERHIKEERGLLE